MFASLACISLSSSWIYDIIFFFIRSLSLYIKAQVPKDFPYTIEWILDSFPSLEILALERGCRSKAEISGQNKSGDASQSMFPKYQNHPLKRLEILDGIDPGVFNIVLFNCNHLSKLVYYYTSSRAGIGKNFLIFLKTVTQAAINRGRRFDELLVKFSSPHVKFSSIMDQLTQLDPLPAVYYLQIEIATPCSPENEPDRIQHDKRVLTRCSKAYFARCPSLKSLTICYRWTIWGKATFRTVRYPSTGPKALHHEWRLGTWYLAHSLLDCFCTRYSRIDQCPHLSNL